MQALGGAPLCPTCDKRVYHAEQTIGPGRRMYHKPCLVCLNCKKRLDAYSLLEHDQEPYCKRCHTTLFGTRDLRSANVLPSPNGSVNTASPGGGGTGIGTRTTTAIEAESPYGRRYVSDRPAPPSPSPRPKATVESRESTGEVEGTDSARPSLESKDIDQGIQRGAYDDFVMPNIIPRPPATSTTTISTPTDVFSTSTPSSTSTATSTTTTIHPNFSSSSNRPLPKPHHAPGTLDERGLIPKSMSPRAKFGGGTTLGGGGEVCDGCGKVVYFAEGISAIGRRWHKSCLKCSECKSTIDAGKVADRNGKPWCRNCYHKLFGPPGIIGR